MNTSFENYLAEHITHGAMTDFDTITINKNCLLNAEIDENMINGCVPEYTFRCIKPELRITPSKNKNKKEKKEVEILDLYKDRKRKQIRTKYLEQRKEIIGNDENVKILRDALEKLKDKIEEVKKNCLHFTEADIITKETLEKLTELDKLEENETLELYKEVEEITSLLELAENYEQKIKILKNYDILDKKGKLNV